MSTPPSQSPPTYPTAVRAIAPDLARGLMLLLIAVANVPWSLYGAEIAATNAHRIDGDFLDRIWQFIAIVAVDGRSYPLFAFLFGYGIWQLYSRQQATGIDPRVARKLLQRRHFWMLAFGLVHAALLWFGDVVGAYGLIGLIVTWLFLDRADRTLRIWAIVLTGALAATAVVSIIGGFATAAVDGAAPEIAIPNFSGIESYPASIVPRAMFWLALIALQGVVGLVVPIVVLLAIVAARHRILESPERHRRLLTRVAIGGIVIGWVGGLPSALVHVTSSDVVPGWAFEQLHSLTGMAGGLGYAAAFGLIAVRVAARGPGRIAAALTAVGKRSLTCYLAQSVLITPILSAWGLGLGAVLTEWQAAFYAVGVWLVTVLVAVALERAGKRGPAEWLLRKLSYRADTAAPTAVVTAS